MFRENTEHLQRLLFGSIDTMLGESQKKAYFESKERWFYELVFKRIDETMFAPLYSDLVGSPNGSGKHDKPVFFPLSLPDMNQASFEIQVVQFQGYRFAYPESC